MDYIHKNGYSGGSRLAQLYAELSTVSSQPAQALRPALQTAGCLLQLSTDSCILQVGLERIICLQIQTRYAWLNFACFGVSLTSTMGPGDNSIGCRAHRTKTLETHFINRDVCLQVDAFSSKQQFKKHTKSQFLF